ncbi:MAG TPA: hypothetical protein VNY24_07405 [Candidatus Acidoferrales bacterium]|nr:hypothetical protein [Candidatus Acidoferrales bacterium]
MLITDFLLLLHIGRIFSPRQCYDFFHSTGPMYSDEPLDTDEPLYQDEPPVFNPALYPRAYKPSIGYLLFLVTTGLLCAAGGIAGMYYFGTGHEMTSVRSQLALVVLSFLFLLLGIYLNTAVLTSRLIFGPDFIEVKDFLSSKLLRRSDIAGYRILPTQYISTLVFQPKAAERKKLKIPLYFRTDAEFGGWFIDIPNLDHEDLGQSMAELEAVVARDTTGIDATEERIVAAYRTAKILNWAAGIASVWAWIYPNPYPLAMLAAGVLPFIAIVLLARSNGLYQIEGRRNDARPSLAGAFIFPSCALAFRTIQDLHFLEWKPLLLATLALAVLLTIFLAQSDPHFHNRRVAAISMLFIGAMFSYGAIAQFDVLADRSAPATYQTQVLGKHADNGRTTTYYLRVAPWGPRHDPDEIAVSHALYSAISPGQPVSIHLYSGALHLPWFSVSPGATSSANQ